MFQGFLSKKKACSLQSFINIYFSSLFLVAEEQAQQRLQAEEAEEQYQTVLRMLNTTTRKTQKKE